ncbi:MAG TPA: LysR family transcriptional regulator, partial [Pseudobdellovibrionaceae bacterium]|nr:LysR family transcriptional regulator [Pseudobdellovibrionaceae bacterium]
MNINSTDLEYFLAVCRTLNLSRASEKLGVTQPTLSLAMKRLESRSNSQLFIRLKSGLRLTRSGELLRTQAHLALNQLGSIFDKLSLEESIPQGVFTLGLHPSVALYTLPKILPNIYEKYPSVQINIHSEISREITAKVIDFKIDFGLVMNPTKHPDLVLRHLLNDEFTLFLPSKKTERLFLDPRLTQSHWLLKKIKKTKYEFNYFVEVEGLDGLEREPLLLV